MVDLTSTQGTFLWAIFKTQWCSKAENVIVDYGGAMNGKSGTHNTYSTDLSQVSCSRYLSPGQIRETEHPQLISDMLRR